MLEGCFAEISGEREKLTIPQTLGPGQRLALPIYMGLRLQYEGEVNGDLSGNHNGFIVAPFWLPISVTIDGRQVIDKARPMSPTPMLTKGEFEIRG